MNNIKTITINYLSKIKNNWNVYLAGVLTPLVIIVILFAIPMKTVTVENTVTYHDIETINEPYTELEPYVSYTDSSNTRVLINGFFKVVPNGVSVPFTIDKLNSRIIGHFENTIPGRFAILGIGDRVVWETTGSRDIVDLKLEPGNYKALFKEDVIWGEDCYIFLTAQWGESKSVVEYREVTKYHKVPVEVDKQQTSEKQITIPLWNYIFGKSPLLK
jgi:hypothetical protein